MRIVSEAALLSHVAIIVPPLLRCGCDFGAVVSSPSRRRRVTVVVSHGCRVIPVLLSPPFCSYCRLCGCSAVVWSSAPASCCTCCVIVVVPELSRCRCRIVVLPALSWHHYHCNIVLSSCRHCVFVAVRSAERSSWEPCPVAVVVLASLCHRCRRCGVVIAPPSSHHGWRATA